MKETPKTQTLKDTYLGKIVAVLQNQLKTIDENIECLGEGENSTEKKRKEDLLALARRHWGQLNNANNDEEFRCAFGALQTELHKQFNVVIVNLFDQGEFILMNRETAEISGMFTEVTPDVLTHVTETSSDPLAWLRDGEVDPSEDDEA